MQNEIRKIANTLRHTFDGTPWHGKSLTEILQDLPVRMLTIKLFHHTENQSTTMVNCFLAKNIKQKLVFRIL
ncbi:MAG: hypothetical protein MUF68_03460 [Cyclobacteriaceae bacterium]|jgi:hypothetical protein|nr:hypothetical protein [Cyclobacteriaceae bacterium]